MSEILFILTTLYVAYVVYMVVDEPKKPSQPHKHHTIITPSGEVEVPEVTATPAVEPAAIAETTTETAVAEPVETKAETTISSSNLRDPDTGEIAKVTNNYRGLKRWLKEALVAEGLLEKVYSNSELNDETNAKIKVALEAIKTMTKYHA